MTGHLREDPAPILGKPSAMDGFHVMAKPTGPICNLDWSYCFYGVSAVGAGKPSTTGAGPTGLV